MEPKGGQDIDRLRMTTNGKGESLGLYGTDTRAEDARAGRYSRRKQNSNNNMSDIRLSRSLRIGAVQNTGMESVI